MITPIPCFLWTFLRLFLFICTHITSINYDQLFTGYITFAMMCTCCRFKCMKNYREQEGRKEGRKDWLSLTASHTGLNVLSLVMSAQWHFHTHTHTDTDICSLILFLKHPVVLSFPFKGRDQDCGSCFRIPTHTPNKLFLLHSHVDQFHSGVTCRVTKTLEWLKWIDPLSQFMIFASAVAQKVFWATDSHDRKGGVRGLLWTKIILLFCLAGESERNDKGQRIV